MFKKSTIPTPMRESALAQHVPARDLEVLHRLGTVVSISEGTPVIRQNTPGREWLMVLDGELEVQKDETPLCSLNNGEFAGELALLSAKPRNATVTAVGADAFLYALNRREFASLLDQAPHLTKIILSTAVDRLHQPTT